MLKIRPEQPADLKTIATLTEAAFRGQRWSSHTEQFIVGALRSGGDLHLSLVAEEDGQVIGHIAVSPVTISDGSSGWFGLGPLSVLPERQRQGIGSQLLQAAIDRLRDEGAAGCVLLGEPEYYHRFNFHPLPGLLLPEVPEEYFMALPFGEARPQGWVSYSPAFMATA